MGRDREIARIVQILSRRTKNNPCLVGEPGVGKTAIAEGLAQRIVAGMVPDTVKNKRVVVLDLSGMVAGSKYRGEFEERIRNVVDEVRENRGILLFIDELHTIIGAGGAEGALDCFQYPEGLLFPEGRYSSSAPPPWRNTVNTSKRTPPWREDSSL